MYIVCTPQVITHPTDTSAAAPFSALFSCSVQAYGYLTVTWYRMNNSLPNKAYSTLTLSVGVTTSVLIIPYVTSEDVGRYYCVAWANMLAAQSQAANLLLAGNYISVVLCNSYIMLCLFRSTVTTSNNDCSHSESYC